MTRISRRNALVLASALLLGAGRDDEFASLLDGGGDPSHALAGFAGIGFDSPTAPARSLCAAGHAHFAPDRAMTIDSPMRVASISKHIAVLGFLQLLERGRLGLDDEASDHLGFRLRHPLYPDAIITLRHLLTHTSGLRNGPSYPVPYGRPLSAALLPGGLQYDDAGWWSPFGQPPGWFNYADVNFAAIAQAMERASGQRFDRYMTEHVFQPLKLDCGYNWSGVSQAARARAATLYRKGRDENHFVSNGPWVAQIDDPPPPAPAISGPRAPEIGDRPLDAYELGTNGFVFAPQGGLRIGAKDLSRLARLLAANGTLDGVEIVRPQSLSLARRPQWIYDSAKPNGAPYGGGGILAYGLGTSILTATRGRQGDDLFAGCDGWVGHLGEAYGLLSGLWIDPRSGAGMVYMLNGVSSGAEANAGARSAFTRQEEALAKLCRASITPAQVGL
jgi:CubicO group peptidase (beta-lactamase class C family)